MLPIFTAGDFVKSASSSPQQNCVRIARRSGMTAIWDDKLRDAQTTDATPLPKNQMLTLTDEEFDTYQNAIRAGSSEACALKVEQHGGKFVFSAADSTTQPGNDVTLHFDQAELNAFLTGVRDHEFDLEEFMAA